MQKLLVFSVAPVLLPSAHGQEVSQTPADDEADHQALREYKALFEKAASENQLDLLRPILHQPFSVVTYTDREFTDFEAFKSRWQKTRDEIVGSGSYKVTLLPVRSEIYGDIAVILSPYDISCALEKGTSLDCKGYIPADAARIAANVLLYALQQ